MGSLTGRTPGQTYKQLLNVGSLNEGLTEVLKSVTDGEGNSSPLRLSTDAIGIQGLTDNLITFLQALQTLSQVQAVVNEAIGTVTTPLQVQTAITAAIDALKGAAPAALDTLVELSAALGNNPNQITEILAAIALRVPSTRKINGFDLTADRILPGYLAYYKTGRGYLGTMNTSSFTTTALVANNIRAFPMIIGKALTILSLSSEVTTAVGGTSFRQGIYTDTGDVYPNTLVAGTDVLEHSGASIGMKTSTFAAPIVLQPGLYWIAFSANGGPTMRSILPASVPSIMGSAITFNATGMANEIRGASAYGVLPGTFPLFGSILGSNPIGGVLMT